MTYLAGEMQSVEERLGFDRCVRLEFHGSKISSDVGFWLYRELDDILGLHDLKESTFKLSAPVTTSWVRLAI